MADNSHVDSNIVTSVDQFGNITYSVVNTNMTQGSSVTSNLISGGKGDNGVGVVPGGTVGQVLAKKTSTDYDTEWVTPSAGGSVNEDYVIAMAVSL